MRKRNGRTEASELDANEVERSSNIPGKSLVVGNLVVA